MSASTPRRAPASVLVVSLDPEVQEVWACLRVDGITCQMASCYEEALELIDGAPCPVLIVDDALGDDVQPLLALARGERAIPLLRLVTGDVTRRRASPKARANGEEQIAKPVVPLELALRVKALIVHAGYELPERPATTATSGALAQSAAETAGGSLTVVFSAKGGTGKTTIAANLALVLAQIYHRKTLLVDADLWFGDLAVLLNTSSSRSLSDVCEGDELDLFGLPKVVVPHPSGVGLVLRPQDPAKVEKLNPKVLALSAGTYKALYDHVIVDTAASLEETNLQLMDAADQILLVTTPEVTAIHNCARFLAVAESLGYASKIGLVLNRADSNANIEPGSIEDTLNLPIRGRVVSAGPLVLEAANTGQSILQLDPQEREQITQDLIALASQVTGEARPEPILEPSRATARRPRFAFFRRAA
jgi:pilus assembly protein CpaE